jgi:hypothetical protein
MSVSHANAFAVCLNSPIKYSHPEWKYLRGFARCIIRQIDIGLRNYAAIQSVTASFARLKGCAALK